MDHQNERALARLDKVDANTVSHYHAVFEFSHLCRLLSEVDELYLRSAHICMRGLVPLHSGKAMEAFSAYIAWPEQMYPGNLSLLGIPITVRVSTDLQ